MRWIQLRFFRVVDIQLVTGDREATIVKRSVPLDRHLRCTIVRQNIRCDRWTLRHTARGESEALTRTEQTTVLALDQEFIVLAWLDIRVVQGELGLRALLDSVVHDLESWLQDVLHPNPVSKHRAASVRSRKLPRETDVVFRLRVLLEVLRVRWVRCSVKTDNVGPFALAYRVDRCDFKPVNSARSKSFKGVSVRIRFNLFHK